jgi:protein ImuB
LRGWGSLFILNISMVHRIAAVHLWALPLEAVFTEPGLNAVRRESRGRWVLDAVSPEAMAQGVRPGATLSEAKARLPALQVRNRDPAGELAALARAAELLFTFGPTVEVCGPDLLFVEVGRSMKALAGATEGQVAEAMERLMARGGHQATVVLAETVDAARTLVQHLSQQALPRPPAPTRLKGRGRARAVERPAPKPRRGPKVARTRVVPPGGEADALGPLPLSALTWTDAREDPEGRLHERLAGAVASLRVLGVADVARLRALPADQIASRFGDAGALLMRRAHAAATRPLVPFVPPDRLVERFELEQVTEALEPVSFVVRRLLERLADRLEARGLAVTKVTLTFQVEPGAGHVIDADAARPRRHLSDEVLPLCFARPTRKAKTFFTVAQDALQGALPGAVRAVSAAAVAPQADRGAQLDLFNAHERRLEAVGELVSRLVATLGDKAVFSPEVANTHRPEAAWRRRAFDIEAALRPPPVSAPRRVAVIPLDPVAGAGRRAADYALPAVEAGLSVTGMSGVDPAAPAAAPEAWPKPVPRAPADEPLPPLPPRPLVLFPQPERATYLRGTGMEEGILVWRGRRYPLVRLMGRERLEAEWWTRAPVERDYVVAEAADGRRFWVFFTRGREDGSGAGVSGAPGARADALGRDGEAFVHGIFD